MFCNVSLGAQAGQRRYTKHQIQPILQRDNTTPLFRKIAKDKLSDAGGRVSFLDQSCSLLNAVIYFTPEQDFLILTFG